jgi:hypothetical protein
MIRNVVSMPVLDDHVVDCEGAPLGCDRPDDIDMDQPVIIGANAGFYGP